MCVVMLMIFTVRTQLVVSAFACTHTHVYVTVFSWNCVYKRECVLFRVSGALKVVIAPASLFRVRTAISPGSFKLADIRHVSG